MEWSTVFDNPTSITLAVIAMLVAKNAIELLKAKATDAMGLRSSDGLAIQRFAVGCNADPDHFGRVVRIDSNTKRSREIGEGFEDKANRGEFGCVWKDRDEVGELKAMIRENTMALKALTVYLQKNGNK